MKDLKAALGSNVKPDLTQVRTIFATYVARPCEYGNVKYERANYLRFTGNGPHAIPTAADFERFRAYLRANLSHVMQTLDAMEMHQSTDPLLQDVDGMRRAAYAVDTDVTPGAKVGASLLPHVAPACASLQMAICQAVACGLLPADPGAAWANGVADGWREPVPAPENTDKMPFDREYSSYGRAKCYAVADIPIGTPVVVARGFGEPVAVGTIRCTHVEGIDTIAEIEVGSPLFPGRENDDWCASNRDKLDVGWFPGPV